MDKKAPCEVPAVLNSPLFQLIDHSQVLNWKRWHWTELFQPAFFSIFSQDKNPNNQMQKDINTARALCAALAWLSWGYFRLCDNKLWIRAGEREGSSHTTPLLQLIHSPSQSAAAQCFNPLVQTHQQSSLLTYRIWEQSPTLMSWPLHTPSQGKSHLP